jgi:hypothetical protein
VKVYAMICLIFLISLATMEYVLNRSKGDRSGKKEPPTPAESCATNLLALGDALDQYGYGQVPGPGADAPRSEKMRAFPGLRS